MGVEEICHGVLKIPSVLLPYQQNSEKEHNAQALLQLEVVM